MAIYKDGKESYVGQVFGTWTHMWMDGMEDEYAYIWNPEEHKVESVQIGYYGIDGRNLYGDSYCKCDLTYANYVDMHRTYADKAKEAWSTHVDEFKSAVMKGRRAKVVRGRKVPIGTELEIFWVGERETYQSQRYHWMHEYEAIAGGKDDNGNKYYVKVEYLENITEVEEPSIEEKKEWMRKWYDNNIPSKMYFTR